MTPTEVVHVPRAEVVRAEDFMPVFTIEQAVARKSQVNQFIAQVLIESEDYGPIPGAGKKKVLLKPGAEKLCSIFGLTPQYLEDKIIEDWTGEDHGGEPLFYYSYRCQLIRGGRFMGEAIGSCNSWESKYRYRWVSELQPDQEATASRGGKISEPVFAIDKAETSGKYGKPAEYWQRFKDAIAAGTAAKVKKAKKDGGQMDAWEIDATMFRIPNPEVPDTINTCQKMAQKRALVAAVLVVTNCSDAFTQDLEDFEGQPPEAPQAPPAQPIETAAVLPAELAALFGPDAPPKATTTAFEMCRRELMEALPDEGENEYRRILEKFGIKKGAQNKIVDVRKACAACWTMAQSLKSLKARSQAQPDLGVNMSDMPYSDANEDVPY